jgi:hypothetical protein
MVFSEQPVLRCYKQDKSGFRRRRWRRMSRMEGSEARTLTDFEFVVVSQLHEVLIESRI